MKRQEINFPVKKVGSYWVAYLAKSGESYRIVKNTKREAIKIALEEIEKHARSKTAI